MTAMPAKRKEPLEMAMFSDKGEDMLYEMGPEQAPQMPHVSLALHCQAKKDASFGERIITLLHYRHIATLE